MFDESQTKWGRLAATNTPPSPQEERLPAMSEAHMGGFAHAINRFLEGVGVSPALTSYVSSLSTSLYGFVSLNELLGIGGLLVAVFTAFVNRSHKRRMADIAERDLDFRIAEARARHVVNTPSAPAAAQDPAKAG